MGIRKWSLFRYRYTLLLLIGLLCGALFIANYSSLVQARALCGDGSEASETGCGTPIRTGVVPAGGAASPSLDIFNKGGKAKWLYYGNFRIENKKGTQAWDYALNPDTKKYELAGAGACSDGTPNDQLEVSGDSVTRKVIVKNPDAVSVDCNNVETISITNVGEKIRKDRLFYQIKDDSAEKNVVHLWNDGKNTITDDGIFRKVPAASGWQEVYTNKDVEDGDIQACPDVIAKDAGGTWRFFPMTTWEWANGKHSYVESAKSRPYANILQGGDTTYNTCRTLGAKIINDYRTGTVDGETFENEKKLRIKIGEDEGLDTNTVSICNSNEASRNLHFFDTPQLAENPHEKIAAVQDDFKIEYIDGTSRPEKGWYWISHCEMTSKGSDNGYHTMILNKDPGKYRLSEASKYRLLVISEQGVGLTAYDGTGDGVNDDGYTATAGVAQIRKSEVSGAALLGTDDPTPEDPSETPGKEKTTCAIDKIGWIICPVIEKSADAADKAFEFLAKGFLETDAELVGTGKGTYDAWKIMRDFANAVFVVVFLIILYSQMTGAGISNYGVKKMLPKLIVGAILVNVSYFICQIAVDLSNILGWSLKGLLENIADSINVSSGNNGAGATGQGGLGLAGIALAVLGAAAIVFLMLPILGGVILTALLVLITIIIILLLRKALIILLVFVSPLAFVAFLLPNTEGLFNKWKDMFIKLLMVFPIVAILMGAGEVASRVILAAGNGADYQTADSSATSATLGLVAAGVAVAPLIAVWSVLQGALAAAGAIGGKIRGAVDKGGGFAGGKVGDAYKNSAMGRGRALRKSGKQAYKDEKFAAAVNDPQTRWQRMRGRAARGVSPLTSSRLRGSEKGLEHLETAAFAAANKHDNEAVSDAADRMTSEVARGGGHAQAREHLDAALASGNSVEARAAMKVLKDHYGENGMNHIQEALSSANRSGALDQHTEMRGDILSHIRANRDAYKSKDKRITQLADNFAADGSTRQSRQAAIDSLNAAGMKDTELAQQTMDAIGSAGTTLDRDQAHRVAANESLHGYMDQGKIDHLANL
ncbi:MAG TPA: hypothetical protein VGE34_04110 [Candidatus Saccharimonadales bacterium]